MNKWAVKNIVLKNPQVQQEKSLINLIWPYADDLKITAFEKDDSENITLQEDL